MKNYEEEYHKKLHNYLINDNAYYITRAKLAKYKYFKGIAKSDKVLEFGCGLGQNIYLIKNAEGYDISKFSLDFAQKKGIKTINELQKIKDQNYDVVFCSHVLEHVEQPKNVLDLIRQKLKKDGKLILLLPVENQKKSDFKLDDSQHLYSWTFKTINNLLIKTGFKPVYNSYVWGTAYKKLLDVARYNFYLYYLLTTFVGYILNKKEMKIVAIKN
jgi:2-polyprenyl-3-methyl-5-hydroxy-6-metoxy-1,4-benzoquinol methylase